MLIPRAFWGKGNFPSAFSGLQMDWRSLLETLSTGLHLWSRSPPAAEPETPPITLRGIVIPMLLQQRDFSGINLIPVPASSRTGSWCQGPGAEQPLAWKGPFKLEVITNNTWKTAALSSSPLHLRQAAAKKRYIWILFKCWSQHIFAKTKVYRFACESAASVLCWMFSWRWEKAPWVLMLVRAAQEESLMFKPQLQRERFSLAAASGHSVLLNVSLSAALMSL